MKYAVIRVGGRQFKVAEGNTFKIERQGKLKVEVLAYNNGKETFLGSPLLEDVTVSTKVAGEELGKKVVVGRFKAKSRYKKKNGHRQPYTIVKVGDISRAGEESKKKEDTTEVAKSEKTEKPAKKTVKKVAPKEAKK